MAIYYVKTGGNDGYTGLSDGQAWATIEQVQSVVTSGDTVYFRSQDTWSYVSGQYILNPTAGVTYDGSTYGSGTMATLLNTSLPSYASLVNISSSNVTFRGFNVNAASHNMFSGIGVGGSGDYIATSNISGITIDNCVVHDVGATDTWQYGIWVGPIYADTTISNVTITNTTVYNTSHEGIAIYPSWGQHDNHCDTITVRGCTIYGTGIHGSTVGFALTVVNHVSNATIENNTIGNDSSTNYVGILVRTSPLSDDTEGNVIAAPTNVVIRNNLIQYNTGSGIETYNYRDAAQATPGFTMSVDIYNNFLLNNGTISSHASDMDFDGDNATVPSTINIYNNTIYNTVSSSAKGVINFISGSYVGVPAKETTVYTLKNNIIYSTTPIPLINNSLSTVTHNNNLYYTSGDTYAKSGATTYTATTVNSTWETTCQNTDPLLTGYVLLPDSPCIRAGLTIESVTHDIDGYKRPGRPGNKYSIGCCEYLGTNDPDMNERCRLPYR